MKLVDYKGVNVPLLDLSERFPFPKKRQIMSKKGLFGQFLKIESSFFAGNDLKVSGVRCGIIAHHSYRLEHSGFRVIWSKALDQSHRLIFEI